MTLEDFAASVHQDYLTIHKHMATKGDLYALGQKMVTREEFRNLQSDVKMITDVMVSKADLEALREELLYEMRHGKSIDGLRERLEVVEKKLGIKSAHRAA